MHDLNKENFMKSTGQKHNGNRPSFFRRWLKSHIAQVLVLALVVSSLPAPAQVTINCSGLSGNALLNCLTLQQSGSGTSSTKSSTSGTTVVIIGVVAAAAITLAILYVLKKKHNKEPNSRVNLEAPPLKFNDVVPGQLTKESVPVTNIMNDPVTVKAVTVDDKSGAFTIGDSRQAPFTIAPGEKFDIPVTLSGNNGGGRARLRIVVATAKTKKDEVKFVNISYGHKKSKLSKLIP
jgi:hypothetical protein